MFSMEWNNVLWQLDPCAKCGRNQWRKDWLFAKKTAGRPRYSCFYCGFDVFPGGAVSLPLADSADMPEIGAVSSISDA